MIRLRLKKATTILSDSDIQKFKTSWGLVVIGVDPACQGKGFGTKLLSEFERLARAGDVECVQLSVKPTNQQAIKSYMRNGWQEVTRSSDSVQMRKDLLIKIKYDE